MTRTELSRCLHFQVTTKEPKGVFIARNADNLDQSAVDPRLKDIEVPLSVLQLAAKLKLKYDLAINAILIRFVANTATA